MKLSKKSLKIVENQKHMQSKKIFACPTKSEAYTKGLGHAGRVLRTRQLGYKNVRECVMKVVCKVGDGKRSIIEMFKH